MSMGRQAFEKRKRWAGPTKPSMKRRRIGHDYYDRGIYMITLVVEGRAPLLGQVTGNGEDVPAVMLPSPLGQAINNTVGQITHHHPSVEVMASQLMPDHLHFLLYVHERMSVHLGIVINGFKTGCNKCLREITGREKATLWESGYNDRIMEGPNHLHRMFDYIRKNPQRFAIKRSHPDLFRIQRDMQVAGQTFAAMGNIFLLDEPWLEQVQCSRSLTEAQIAEVTQSFLDKAQRGAILVSPCISHGEKEVMRAAFEHGFSLITLQENGFAPLAKPGGRRFEACAQGRLLMLAPWEHHNDRRVIQRTQCLELNEMARLICNNGAVGHNHVVT